MTKKNVIKTKILPIGLAAVMASSMTGCVHSKKNEDDSLIYTIEKTEEQKDFEEDNNYLDNNVSWFHHVHNDSEDVLECEYYVDLNNTPLSYAPDATLTAEYHINKFDYDLNEDLNEEGFYNKDFIYPVRHINYTNGKDFIKFDKARMFNFCEKNLIIVPNEYKYIWDNKVNLDGSSINMKLDLKYVEYFSTGSSMYLTYDCTLTAKDNIKLPYDVPAEITANYGEQKGLHDGEFLRYKALYKIENENTLTLLADTQDGVGSDSENVKEAVMNNYDDIFKPIRSFTKNNNYYYYDLDHFYFDTYETDIIPRVKKK